MSSLNVDASSYYCSLSSGAHIVDDGVVFNGSIACRDCALKDGNTEHEELSRMKSEEVKTFISSNLKQLFGVLNERYFSSMHVLKSNLNNIQNRVSLEVEFIIEEIDIRIESVRIELEKLKQEFIDELNKHKNEFNKHIQVYSDFEKNFEELKAQAELTESSFYSHQSQLKQLDELLDEVKLINDRCHIGITINERIVEKGIVGKINTNLTGFKNSLVCNKPEKRVFSEYEVADICELPNGNLLVAHYEDCAVAIYDPEFKLVMKVENFNGHSDWLEPLSVTTDGVEAIYILSANTLFRAGLDLDYENEFEFEFYRDLKHVEWHRGVLYVYDISAKVYKLTSTLEILSEHTLTCPAAIERIKFLNDTMCMVNRALDRIFFCNLNFQVLKELAFEAEISPSIATYNGELIVFSKSTVSFFNETGSCLESIAISEACVSCCCVYRNRRLLILNDENKMIIY